MSDEFSGMHLEEPTPFNAADFEETKNAIRNKHVKTRSSEVATHWLAVERVKSMVQSHGAIDFSLSAMLARIKTDEKREFNSVWGFLCTTYQHHPHCFKKGCSRATLAKWVNIACGLNVPPNELRRVLVSATDAGLMIRGVAAGGYSTFAMRGEVKQTIVITSTVEEFDRFMNKRDLSPRNKDYINVCTCHYSGQEIIGNRRLENYNIIYCEGWKNGMYWQDVEAGINLRLSLKLRPKEEN